MQDREMLEELLAEARITNKLIAMLATREFQSEKQIELLAQVGLKPKVIAEVLGKTTNYVGVSLHRLRKHKPGVEEKPNGGNKAKPKNPTKA